MATPTSIILSATQITQDTTTGVYYDARGNELKTVGAGLVEHPYDHTVYYNVADGYCYDTACNQIPHPLALKPEPSDAIRKFEYIAVWTDPFNGDKVVYETEGDGTLVDVCPEDPLNPGWYKMKHGAHVRLADGTVKLPDGTTQTMSAASLAPTIPLLTVVKAVPFVDPSHSTGAPDPSLVTVSSSPKPFSPLSKLRFVTMVATQTFSEAEILKIINEFGAGTISFDEFVAIFATVSSQRNTLIVTNDLLDTDISTIEDERDDALAEVKKLTGELTAANAEVKRLTGELTTANAEVTKLTRELNAASGKTCKSGPNCVSRSQHDTAMSEVVAKFNEANAATTEANENTEKAKGVIINKNKKIASLKSDLANEIAAHDTLKKKYRALKSSDASASLIKRPFIGGTVTTTVGTGGDRSTPAIGSGGSGLTTSNPYMALDVDELRKVVMTDFPSLPKDTVNRMGAASLRAYLLRNLIK
jgi:hypothetical protein